MSAAPGSSDASGWRDFFDLLSDPVVVVDRAGRVVFANSAALRLAPCEAGQPLDQWQRLLGAAAIGWWQRASVGLTRTSVAPPVRLVDGRSATIAWRRLDTRHGALHLTLAARPPERLTVSAAEPQQSQQQSQQLLRELSTILESTTAGIAYLRGDLLVRCNRRFGAMLGLRAGALPGTHVERLFSGHPQTEHIGAEVRAALGAGAVCETEFELAASGGRRPGRWYSLSVRRVGPASAAQEAFEAIAVLTDVTRLKTQQRELEILARDRELMFSLSGVGIAFLRDGRVQRANPALAQLTGSSVADLLQRPLAELFADAAGFERLRAQQQIDLRQRGQWDGEHQLRAREGRRLWVHVSQRFVTAGDPSDGIIFSCVDVDARYRAERAAATQAERTRAILNSVLVGIVTVGPNGIEWMNRSARRMFGGDLADFLNQPIATVAPPEPNHPFLRTDYLTTLVEGAAETFECRVLARDGRDFWIVGNVVSTGRSAGGHQLTYALLDIERRRDAEARMSQAQAQLQRLIEAAPLAITLCDARTLSVLRVNEVAAGNVGSTPDALIGCSPEQMYGQEIGRQRRRDMALALASTQVTKHEYRAEVDGKLHIWEARYLPLAERPGAAPDQLLLVATNVTEQRVAQEARFEAAMAQRDMLVREVHHRIKNNLQGVAGLLQQIAQRKPEVAGAISEVVSQVQAIAQVYGLQVGESGPLQLMSVTQAITVSVQRTFGRTIRFEVLGDAPHEWTLPEAESIPMALTLNELLTNAVKHSAVLVDRDELTRAIASAPVDPAQLAFALVDAPLAATTAIAIAPDVDTDVICTLDSSAGGVQLRISNLARLPAGFNLARIPSGVSGLGLVRALLPRRSASLSLAQDGARVVATVALRPPGLVRSTAPG